jgi:hypothetical protein
MDAILAIFTKEGGRVTYNKSHIALGTLGRNFAWFHPRKSSRNFINVFTGPDGREELTKELEDLGIESSVKAKNIITMSLTNEELTQNFEKVLSIFKHAEQVTRR